MMSLSMFCDAATFRISISSSLLIFSRLFSLWKIVMISSICFISWPSSITCVEKLERPSSQIKSFLCSLNVVLKFLFVVKFLTVDAHQFVNSFWVLAYVLKFSILLFNMLFSLLLVLSEMFIFLPAFLISLEIFDVSLPIYVNDIYLFGFYVSIFCNAVNFYCFPLFPYKLLDYFFLTNPFSIASSLVYFSSFL